jgi:subtilisin family serine protease
MMFTADLVETPIGPVLRSTSEPAVAPAFLRQPLRLDHRPPQVLVLDTGLRTANAKGSAVEHPELTCARLHSPWLQDPVAGHVDDEDEYDDDGSGTLDLEAGHGTFITGIVQQLCPDAEVHVGGVLSSFGDGDVATVIAAFENALTHAGPFDIVILSLGGYMTDDDGALFGAALGRLLGDGLGIAAAGNQLTSRPYFPAALPSIVGVGALGEGDKAWFTNFGGWVDACAPGIDVVSTFFLDDADAPVEPPFTGWARWSGTSFSAPKVAGVVAQEMYLTESTAREAWRRMSHHSRYRFPDLGTVFNV